MPGSGKTSLGQALANIQLMRFIDTDDYIEKKCKKTISQIVEEKGEERFKKIEAHIIKKCAKKLFGNYVIATGGSAVLSDKLMQYLKKENLIIYLYHNYESLEKRLKNQDRTGRAIIGSKSMTLEEIYNLRELLYRKYADKIVDVSNRTFNESVFDILNSLKIKSKN